MVKRLLDCYASDLAKLRGRELIESIRLSEGRVVAAELVVTAPPLLAPVTNAELAAAMGADLLLLNFYDVTQPQVHGVPATLADVQRLTGRVV